MQDPFGMIFDEVKLDRVDGICDGWSWIDGIVLAVRLLPNTLAAAAQAAGWKLTRP